MANKYIQESVSKFARGVKQLLLIGGLALLASCSSSSSTDNASLGKSATGLTSTQVAKFESERISLMASLAKLYPNGQLTPEQAAAASKALAQNPAALNATGKSSKQDVMYGQAGVSLVGSDFLPVYRIQNTTLAGSYFFTIYESEKTAALAANPDWKYEGPAFYATTLQGDGLSPVWRFRNKVNGSYLFTIYDSELADIANNYAATFEYEGISWYASQTAAAGYSPLHRFRNLTNGTYLFSAYESEKNAIIANYPAIFAYEGISYYVRVSPPPTDNNITAVVKDGNIVLPASATSGSNTVVPLKAGGVQIDSTDITVVNLKTNDIVYIAPRSGGLAFPFAGKVTSITTVDGKQQVRLVPANVEDVYDKLSWDIDTSRSDAVIGGVIAPQNARATFSQTRPQKTNSFYKPMLSVIGSLKDEDSKINGTVELSQDLVDAGGKKITLTAKIDVSNLALRSKAEFDPKKFATGGGWANMSAVVAGEVAGSVSLSGSTEANISLGTLLASTDVWDQLKWRGGDMFTLEGLDSKDKAGRIPLGGIILVPYAATTFTGNLPSSAITLLSIAPSAVLWLYLDMSGNITAEGEVGWRTADNKFERGYELVANGLELQATKINTYTNGRQELFAKGSIKATQKLGFTVAADVLVGGIRPLNVSAFLGNELKGSFAGEGIREITPTTNLTGNLCVTSKLWAGGELSMSARVKAKLTGDLYFFQPSIEGVVQTEVKEKVFTLIDSDLGSSCVASGLFSISASVQGPDAAVSGNSLVNVDFTPAYNNGAINTKTDHWWVKASCSGCADINIEIPRAQAGIGAISLPTGKNYTLTLEAKSDDYGVIKSATTTVNISAAPTASFAAAANNSSCSNINLTATAAATGGRAITSYAWTVQRTGAAVQNYTGNPVSAVSLPSCGSTVINLTVTDSLGYTTTVTQTVNTTNLGASVTNITPTTATVNTPTVFTVTGTNLPLTAVLVVVSDHTCLSPVNNSSTGFSQTCTPMATGIKAITIKTAPSGTVIDNTRTVNVTAAPVAGNIDLPATSYLRGTNVALSVNGYGADALMNAPPYIDVPNAAEWDFIVPVTGSYQLFAIYASGESRPSQISFNGTQVFANALASTTGGFFPANRQTLLQGIVQLTAGANTMRVSRSSAFPHIKGFSLVLVNSGVGLLNPANGHRYEVITCGAWNQCDAAARAKGGNLVTIRNSAENTWLLANIFNPSSNVMFIGLFKTGSTWSWSSGEPVAFTAWLPGNPDNYLGNQNYVHLSSGNLLWDDVADAFYGPSTQAIVEYSNSGTLSVAANLSTGTQFTVPAGATSCTFNASGSWMYGSTGTSSADGDATHPNNPSYPRLLGSVPYFALIARTTNGYISIGSSKTLTTSAGSTMYFQINEGIGVGDSYADNSGALSVSYSCN